MAILDIIYNMYVNNTKILLLIYNVYNNDNSFGENKIKRTLIVKLKETRTCSKYIVLRANYLSYIFIQILFVIIPKAL